MLCRFAALSTLALCVLCGCAGDRDFDSAVSPAAAPTKMQESQLVGRLLLPGEGGRRGVELHAWSADSPDAEPRQLWILPEADGRFAREVSGTLTRDVSVLAGSEVLRIDLADVSRASTDGRVDLGEIDLRELLVSRHVRVLAQEGEDAGGVVRVALSIGPSHRGPLGELPSLGSAQFPTTVIGSEMEWLLLPEATDIYFLVERPKGSDYKAVWRSGKQQAFGPYEPSDFPLELQLR